MAGYNPKKAAAYNKLRQQGLSEDQAARQAGISEAEDRFYETNEVGSNNPKDASYNPNFGKMGPPVQGANAAEYNKAIASGKTEQQAFAELEARRAEAKAERAASRDEDADDETFERSPVAINEKTPPNTRVVTQTVTTETETVSGGGSRTTVSGPKVSTAGSEALQPAINAKQAEIDQFNKDNPSPFARKKQGLPPLTPEENEARIAKQSELNDQATRLRNGQTELKADTPPTVTTVPNTTTTTQTVTTSTSSTNQAVNPINDEKLSQENETQLEATTSAANATTARSGTPVSPEDDPFEAERLEREQALNDEPVESLSPEDVNPEDDPFEAERLEREQELNRQELADTETEAEPVDAEQLGNDYGFTSEETEGADPPPLGEPEPVTLSDEEILARQNAGGLSDEEIIARNPEPVTLSDEEILARQNAGNLSDEEILARNPPPVALSDEEILARQNAGGLSDEEILARQEVTNNQSAAAFKARVKSQGTLQSRYKQPGNGDWRVRLSLAPYSDYLYNATGAGILAPLTATNGVIFPYTPNITTTYSADYEKYNLIHSNYRGLFYKSSSVGDLQIRGTFTAQDTREAAYLLAVIHFFRSVTKMFYGQDAERGTPPPLVYLSGYGDQQFSSHPCVVGQFNYSLPNEVDYIRTNGPNNFGPNMSNRQTPTASSPGGANFAGAIRLANALLNKGAIPQLPAANALRSAVNNTNECTYVPTKMEIDITLIPVQTRSQVSKQFSLKEFANGNLLKKGFW
jgi:hypothetical protein